MNSTRRFMHGTGVHGVGFPCGKQLFSHGRLPHVPNMICVAFMTRSGHGVTPYLTWSRQRWDVSLTRVTIPVPVILTW